MDQYNADLIIRAHYNKHTNNNYIQCFDSNLNNTIEIMNLFVKESLLHFIQTHNNLELTRIWIAHKTNDLFTADANIM